MWGCFFKGPEANQPTEVAAQWETIEVNEDLFKELQEAVQQDEANTQEIDVEVVNTSKEENHHNKKSRRKTTQHDTLEAQYKALVLKQENLKLKKRKLELEVFLLEQRSCSIPTVSINLSP